MKNYRIPALALALLSVTVFGFGNLTFIPEEYAARRARLMDLIPDGIAVVLGTTSQTGYHPFFQNNDFLYLSGVAVPNAVLIIDGRRRESTIFYSLTEREARNEGISLDLVSDPVKTTGIEQARPLEQFSPALAALLAGDAVLYTSFLPEELHRECTNAKLRILQKTMILNEWDGRMTREMQFIRLLKERFPQLVVKDLSPLVHGLRIIKSDAEIDLLRRIGRIGVKAHNEVIRSTRPGMHEYELSALYKYFCEKEGAQDLAYYMIICSGENHPYVHYYKHDRVLKDGDFLVIDVGPDMHNYDVDITVSYPVNGRFTARQKEIYRAANAMHNACMSLYRPGVTVEEVRKRAAEILTRQGFDLSSDVFQKRTMQGGFGHYVGMAVHDVGGGPQVLKPGMVFANEPYATFPGEDLGVRVEDTILITETGCENLTAGIPREIDEIEAFMKKQGVVQILKEAGAYR